MRNITRRAQLLSTCSLILAVLTFFLWRFIFSHAWDSRFDPCDPSRVSPLGNLGVWLYVGDIVLSFASVGLGFVALKRRSIVRGFLAVGISCLNMINVPYAAMRPSEVTAVTTLRTINVAEVEYLNLTPVKRPPVQYGTLADLVKATLVDERFSKPTVFGYTYNVVLKGEGSIGQGYVATATPIAGSPENCWEYYSTEDAVVRYSTNPERAPKRKAGLSVR